MILARFHWTARKPTLIAPPRSAARPAVAGARRAPALRRSQSSAPAPATAPDARIVASASFCDRLMEHVEPRASVPAPAATTPSRRAAAGYGHQLSQAPAA